MPAAVDLALEGVAGGDDLVVAFASPASAAKLRTEGDKLRRAPDGRVPYRFVEADSDLDAELAAIVAACSELGARVLVLPELEVPPWSLVRLRRHLFDAFRRQGTLALVIAGSWHLNVGGHLRNRATVLSGWGDDAWFHDKLAIYGIPAAEAATMPEAVRELLGIDEQGGREDVGPGAELHVRDLRLGRLAVATCLDFCGGGLDDLFVGAGVNLLFVPAMTSSTAPFRERAKLLGERAGTWAWVANSGWWSGAASATRSWRRDGRGGRRRVG